MSHTCREIRRSAAIPLPEEAEAGSAGKQPAKEYPGLRCAHGVSAPGRGGSARGLFESRQRPHWSHASVNPYAVRHFEIPPNSRMNHKKAVVSPRTRHRLRDSLGCDQQITASQRYRLHP